VECLISLPIRFRDKIQKQYLKRTTLPLLLQPQDTCLAHRRRYASCWPGAGLLVTAASSKGNNKIYSRTPLFKSLLDTMCVQPEALPEPCSTDEEAASDESEGRSSVTSNSSSCSAPADDAAHMLLELGMRYPQQEQQQQQQYCNHQQNGAETDTAAATAAAFQYRHSNGAASASCCAQTDKRQHLQLEAPRYGIAAAAIGGDAQLQ
jgi:hypothetical protein